MVTNVEWDEVEWYLSGLVNVDDNRYSMKIFFEKRKQKYLEAQISGYAINQKCKGPLSGRKANRKLEINTTIASLLKDLHGASPDSFIVVLAEASGCLKTLRRMASF
ncbi:hypothetical protein L1987_17321 [Smallanthus sonchifolius]|uniref:Uncharacterized protein n=1 Tax=Smallanthus sonchifolius TaxID=185202 RepID=A0ACB9IX67_9ASTR|nr:hypothetical protein L1987_17321 [Smallanthus sonchifolius]